MLIGELAKKAKLSRHTIRFYEKMGLISVPETSRRTNNYKEYSEDVLKRIAAVRHIKAKGFTLKEAKGIIHLVQTGMLDPERSRKYLLKKIAGIEKQIKELNDTRKGLLEMVDQCGSDYCDVRLILKGQDVLS
jgi:DNA-binding transcriptional MerR regulator